MQTENCVVLSSWVMKELYSAMCEIARPRYRTRFYLKDRETDQPHILSLYSNRKLVRENHRKSTIKHKKKSFLLDDMIDESYKIIII